MTHHNTVLMRDTHAGLAQVLDEMRSVNPDMHRHQSDSATDDKRGAERQRRDWEEGRLGHERVENKKIFLGEDSSATMRAMAEMNRLRKVSSSSEQQGVLQMKK